MKNNNALEKFAILLHDEMCTSDHADKCGWHYEINNGVHDFTKCAHERWLEKAVKVLNLFGDATGINVYSQILKGESNGN